MASKKTDTKKGILPKLKAFMEALGDRYQRALLVIDEALASDNLKDRIWAVDFIFKRTPTPDASNLPKPTEDHKSLSTDELAQLGEAELLERIRKHLKDWEP